MSNVLVPSAMSAEPVRLVIWDLDDTFWSGTLAEGAVVQRADTTHIVRELAQRGIVSALCSKNDFERVKSELSAWGLWDYFIFPSISWDAKGPRIQALIEQSQLRPASVLFIDDNASNLEEAKHFTPELRVAGVDIIPHLLADPLLAGKSDPELVRLKQYKTLEQRKADQARAPGGVEEFLRQSDIRVEFRHDLDTCLDRVIELINRTNQLNFTKARLPEDPAAARASLLKSIQSHEVSAGLLRVADRYGDHGYSGFYMVHNSGEVLHYCFSCRILGMGVESWLYQRLGRPRLHIVGEVLTNPVQDQRQIDWIRVVESVDAPIAVSGESPRFDWVMARGGCDLQALSHYFKVSTPTVVGEFNVGRHGFDARVDHSIFLRYALEGLAPEAIRESEKLGYRPEDYRTAITLQHPGRGLVVLSFWGDVSYALYRHRRLDFLVPFALSGRSNHMLDARTATVDELPENLRTGWMAQALGTLQADYDYVGVIDEHSFKENLGVILRSLPASIPVVVLQGNTRLRDSSSGVTHTWSDNLLFNQWIADVAATHSALTVVNIRDVISSEDEVTDWSHFDRIVYYRLYQRIRAVMSSRGA